MRNERVKDFARGKGAADARIALPAVEAREGYQGLARFREAGWRQRGARRSPPSARQRTREIATRAEMRCKLMRVTPAPWGQRSGGEEGEGHRSAQSARRSSQSGEWIGVGFGHRWTAACFRRLACLRGRCRCGPHVLVLLEILADSVVEALKGEGGGRT
eukprot:scaffold293535_cov31-Tisochrysis_lutea.AAC.1